MSAKWVGVGSSTTAANTVSIIWSPDGINFYNSTNVESIFSAGYSGVCVTYGNGIWVAGFRAGQAIGYSTDGNIWTVSSNASSLLTDGAASIYYANGKFVAVGYNGQFCSSPNGNVWTAGTYIAGLQGWCIHYWPEKAIWLCGAYATGGSSAELYWSADGNTWSQSNNGTTKILGNSAFSLCSNGTIAVAGGNGSGFAWSTDGKTWNAITTAVSTPNGWRNIIWNGTTFFATGVANTNYAKSTDGKIWTSYSKPAIFNSNQNALWYDPISKLTFIGQGNTPNSAIIYSSDLTTWYSATVPATVASVNALTPYIPIPQTPSILYANIGISGNTNILFNQPSSNIPISGYYYSTNGTNYNSTTPVANVITIPGKAINQPISIISYNSGGNSIASTSVSIGTTPVINSITAQGLSLLVSLTPSTGGNPPATAYLYSTDGGNTFNNSINSVASSITIGNLSSGISYKISIKATGTYWVGANSAVSNAYTVSGLPTTPNIISVNSQLDALYVSFYASTNGSPAATYYYSITGNVATGYTQFTPNIVGNSNTFIISTTTLDANVSLLAQNTAGNVYSVNTVIASPYLIGTAPVISSVSSIYNGLSVDFSPSTNGYPEPSSYFYSIDGGNTFTDSGNTTSPLTITGLTTARSYFVSLLANSVAGKTSASVPFIGIPYVIGSSPGNVSVSSAINSIVVNFSPSANGYPLPSSYFYSLDGGNSFTDSLTNFSPIVVSNLTTPAQYSVVLYGKSLAGNTAYTSPVMGAPYIIGSTPNISNVLSGYNSITINYTPSTSWYPNLKTYYYSIDGGITFTDGNTTATQITLANLTNPAGYSVSVKAGSNVGNTSISNVVSGTPYVIGSAPSLSGITSILNGISINFVKPTDGYPDPTGYYYSLDGGNNFVNANSNVSPIVVSGLKSLLPYSVSLKGVNPYWPNSTPTSISLQGQPYIIGTTPSISNVSSIYNGLSVEFSPSLNGYPAPISYYYSIDGGNNFVDSVDNTSPLSITGLKTPAPYSVVILAYSLAGNSNVSNTGTGTPYVIGTAPYIANVVSIINGMSIEFSQSANGYPTPSSYFYSINGGFSFVDSGSNVSPIIVRGLDVPTQYSVILKANSIAGMTESSNSVDGQPYVTGTAPVISSVRSLPNGLSVYFSASSQGYPEPTSYYYSIDGGNTFKDSLSTVSPIQISNLFVAKMYNVVLYANGLAGNTAISNAYPGQPAVLGSVPVIANVASRPYAVSVSFTGSLNGYPEPATYFYSIDGGNTAIDSLSNTSPMLISFPGITTSNIYSVQIYASGDAGNTGYSLPSSGRPYVVGTAPVISNISSLINGLSVSFVGSTGGFPNPTSYLYSVDGGASFTSWGTTTSPIIIGNLLNATPYSVKLIAVNEAGNSLASNIVQQTPYVAGTAPTIIRVDGILDGISIVYTPPQNSYPNPTTYYYSLDGGDTYTNANSNSNPLVVGNLSPGVYSVSIYAVNAAGSTAPSASVAGAPFVIGSAPFITSVASGRNSITINFNGSSGGSTSSYIYYYSLDGGQTFTNSGLTSSPILVSGLNTRAIYSVVIYSVSDAGKSNNSNTVQGQPYVIGTAPTIANVGSIPGGLSVYYTAPANAYPSPNTYYYSLNSGPYINALSAANPLLITGLIYTGTYSVRIFANSLAGNSYASDAVSGKPYILGTVPVISKVDPDINKLTIYFSLSTGGDPDPTTYLYTLDGNNYVDALQIKSPIVVSGLTQAIMYHVSVKAQSLAGNTAASNSVDKTPYVVGSPPVITNVVSDINQMSVYFSATTNGFPAPSTYLYSIDGVNYVDSVQNSNATPIIISVTTPGTYPIRLKAINLAGSTNASSPFSGFPYIPGTAPAIDSVRPVAGLSGALSVAFRPSEGGYPNLTTYYYSVDGGSTFKDSLSATSPIIISGLTLQTNPYQVALTAAFANNWVSPASSVVPGVPYIVGSPIAINRITPFYNGLSVDFADSYGGYPNPTAYYYTLDGGNSYSVSGNVASPIIIDGLTVANTYSVGLIAHNLGGNTGVSNLVPAIPYVIGQPPVISNIVSRYNGLRVEFSPPAGGYPAPTAYYYSLDFGNTFIDANTATSPILIDGLYISQTYHVEIVAQNIVGNTEPSAPTAGRPYTIGGNIVIDAITSIYNGLTVDFTKPTGWYPDLTTYYYSVDGIHYVLANTSSSSSQITIDGLTVANTYSVYLQATNSLGNTAGSNAVLGNPYVIGTAPVIQSLYNYKDGVVVAFFPPKRGYPEPSTYLYSIDGGNSYQDSGIDHSPLVIKDLAGKSSYDVSLKAVNAAGVGAASNIAHGNAYLAGIPPIITGIESVLNGLVVSFTPSPETYATPIVYMYSLDGGNYVDTGCTGSPLTIGNLSVSGTYDVRIRGFLQISNVSTPYGV